MQTSNTLHSSLLACVLAFQAFLRTYFKEIPDDTHWQEYIQRHPHSDYPFPMAEPAVSVSALVMHAGLAAAAPTAPLPAGGLVSGQAMRRVVSCRVALHRIML
jgi:hypothetical protein